MSGLAVVDPHVQAAMEEVDAILERLHTAFRKEEKLMVLQLYDMLTYTPQLQELAQRVMEVRPECQILEAEELSVNVLAPDFVAQRVQQLSQARWRARGEDGRLRSAGGSTNASSGAVSPGSLAINAAALQSSPFGPGDGTDRHVSNGSHSGVSYGAGAAAVSATAKALYDVERRIEHASALGLLTAQEQAPDEEDHHLEMLEDFEVKFCRPSELLRAVRGQSSSAQEVCDTYRCNEGNITPDVVLGALLKHPPRSTDEIASLVSFIRESDVPLTVQVAEMLERCYVKCMKAEGAEFVFHRMTKEVGLVPLTTRPFAMLFNSKKFTMVKSVLDYYELMLDYGIAPEPSLLRILCKQCGGMEYASLHFTLRLKSHEQQQQQQQQQQKSKSPAAQHSANAHSSLSPTPAPPDSRRKNERAYFEKRLEDMADQNPDTPLMEAMKVVHRAEVEGTSLEGDTLILTALLKLFCNGTTPAEDLVKPFSASIAYRPGEIDNRAALEAAAAAEEDRRRGGGGGGRGAGRFTEENAFDFGLDGAQLETLDDVVVAADADPNASAVATGKGQGGGGGETDANSDEPPLSGLMGGGAAALFMELEGEGLLDGGLEDGDEALGSAGGDDDLEELAHQQFMKHGGGGKSGTIGATLPRAHADSAAALEEDDAGDSLDDELEEGEPLRAKAMDQDSRGGSSATASAVAAKAANATAGDTSAKGSTAAGKAGQSSTAAASTSERSRRTPRHIPGIASPSEEAAYVLDVLASYKSLPDNNVLNLLATQYVNRGNSGIGVVQQVTQALFRAGHESRGAVEAVRSSSCHCLVRYYIRRHQRSKLTQLVRSFVEQCYEYNHVFRSSWAGDLDPRSANYYLRNNTTFSAFATAAMKAGPLDWALGLLALVLCMSSHPITDNTKARLCQVRDGESYNSPHRDMVDLFDECDWDRDRILAADHNESGSGGGGGSGGAEVKDGAAPNAHAGDIYTTSVKEAQQMSSYENPRGLNGPSNLETYMHNALREMNLSRDVVEYFKGRLRAEREEAVERVRGSSRRGAPASASGSEHSRQQHHHHHHHRGRNGGRR